MPPRERPLGLLLVLCLAPPLAATARGDERPSAPGAAGPTQVTLPLGEYERLRKAAERPSLTVVDVLRLSGSFQGRSLGISFQGRSAGSLPAVDVLAASGVVVYGCEGDGLLHRGENGAFRLAPLAAKFDVRCRLRAAGSDRVELTLPNSVLWLESTVSDAELVTGTESDDGGRRLTLVRTVAEGAADAPPTATGRYRVTLLPDETRFRYQIDVRNPNRSRRPFDVTFASGERVQKVDASSSWEAKDARYRFDLPPGESTLVLTGTLTKAAFAPPVPGSLSYLVLESHPLLRPAVSSTAKRISPQESGLTVSYRGALAFLVGKADAFAWTVKRLEALSTTSFAVRHAAHVFFFPTEGKLPGETHLEIDNPGASELVVPVDPEPTYAGFGAEPVLLTKGPTGELLLPLASGPQSLLLQHRQAFAPRFGFAFATLAIPRMPVSASTTTVELRYPKEWLPLYERFSTEARVAVPSVAGLVAVALLLWAFERALAALGLEARGRALLVASAAVAALLSEEAAVAVALSALVVFGLWLKSRLPRFRPNALTVILLVLGIGFLAVVVLIGIATRSFKGVAPGSAGYMDTMNVARSQAAPTPSKAAGESPEEGVPKPSPEPEQAEAYQGLPARLDLPSGVRQTRFSRELLPTDRTRPIRVVLVAATFVSALRAASALVLLFLLLRRRRAFAAGARALATKPRPEPAS